MRIALHRRPGFTLMELIVVIGIIVLLAGLTAGAVFRLRAGQLEKNTNTHLQKIHTALMNQYSPAVDRIKKEDPPQIVKEFTKNSDGTYDLARAKALHLKLRLRQEFPNNFGEVRSGVTLTAADGSRYVYQGKASFNAAIKNPYSPGPNLLLDPVPEGQSSAMLVLILSQGQGGAALDPNSIAPTRLIEFPQGPSGQTSIPLRVFVDEWGTPISFRRWADDDMLDVLADLNPGIATLPPDDSNNPADFEDPERRLMAPASKWAMIQTTNGMVNGKVLAASYLASNNPQTRPFIQNPFDGRKRGPFVFSAGGNTRFHNPDGTMERDLDNLYSFRLAQSGKGN